MSISYSIEDSCLGFLLISAGLLRYIGFDSESSQYTILGDNGILVESA